MYDRAMQALYKLALAPVAETTADRNSYGFRESRGCADAIATAFNALSKPNSAMEILIKKLNAVLRGWANYHRHVVSSRVFQRVDTYVYEQLWRMLRRRHPKRTKKWLVPRYWTAAGRKWIFAVKSKYKGKTRVYQVLRVCSIGIKRHIKVRARADANPYMPEHARYFWQRRHNKDARLLGALSARQLRAQAA